MSHVVIREFVFLSTFSLSLSLTLSRTNMANCLSKPDQSWQYNEQIFPRPHLPPTSVLISTANGLPGSWGVVGPKMVYGGDSCVEIFSIGTYYYNRHPITKEVCVTEGCSPPHYLLQNNFYFFVFFRWTR